MTRTDTRIRNPFHDPLVTELIEDPRRYTEMFSEEILVGEALAAFRPTNVVVVGPQGAGKSMLLNLLRYNVLSEWISKRGKPPEPIKKMAPFFGISVNLVRAGFHAFGRRSVSAALAQGQKDQSVDAACAADFINHYLFREFIRALHFLGDNRGKRLKAWLTIDRLDGNRMAAQMSSWDCWYGYYSGCVTLQDLLDKCEQRLSVWRSFLNANIDTIPEGIWQSKATLGDPLHAIGNLLSSGTLASRRIPLFVIIDQYEVLPELNPSFGTTLQRIVNTLIKARDPVVFYKIGARTYDWGTELRVWGAESRIEIQRDYVLIDLADLLMRNEDKTGWLYPQLAIDVAHKRINVEGHFSCSKDVVPQILGKRTPAQEAAMYFPKGNDRRKAKLVRGIPESLKLRIEELCRKSPLEMRLAGAWVLQQLQRGVSESKITREVAERPWSAKKSWRKERIDIALLQIASVANQRRYYFSWETALYLSGANISVFLLIFAEIWDMASKADIHPLKNYPLDPQLQTDGIFVASDKWRNRDRNEQLGGRKRYEALGRLGSSIHDYLIHDFAISNPGHSGFSLRESDLWSGDEGNEVGSFLQRGVSWAMLEERIHTSKQREAATRRKWYLHPVLSPAFAIPFKRAKEPYYTSVNQVYSWFFGADKPKFGRTVPGRRHENEKLPQQLEMALEDGH